MDKQKIIKPIFPESESSSAIEHLRKLAYEGAERIYGSPLPNDVIDRLQYELHTICANESASYFLFLHNTINAAKELDVWIGPGRGSAPGCLVNYCLGITKIDPIEHGLLFERFMNPDRIEWPDIDIDFDVKGVGKIWQWLKEKHGKDNCARIGIIDYVTHLLAGIHTCGYIVTPNNVNNYVPVTLVDDPDNQGQKTLVTMYDAFTLENMGFVKFDFLKLHTLSKMKECVHLIKEHKGINIDIDHIPVDDEKTLSLFQEGRTSGIFIFDSPNQQIYLRKLHPTVFSDLVMFNSLYRPGPIDFIPSFIEKKNGRDKITYDLPVMEKYLKDTYGIMVYQEQMMLLSRRLANFTRGESNALRMALAKKTKVEIDLFKPKFIEGGKRNGYDSKVLEKIWADLERDAPFLFNKSHAVAYTWLAYQTAYLKVHYPEEFERTVHGHLYC